MSAVKLLLDELLWDIYGKQQSHSAADGHTSRRRHRKRHGSKVGTSKMQSNVVDISRDPRHLQKLSVRKLVDISAILKVELRLMGYFLERVLISRDRNRRHQEILCGFVDAVLQVECHDAEPTMRFSLSPPPSKTISAVDSPAMQQQSHSGNDGKTAAHRDNDPTEATDDATSDYKQWLHAMKLVARLPGGMPPEFRRKLWLSLADKYLKSKDVLWEQEEKKCFCEEWREDDEELGIQIVKDLHRTGSNLCTGPAGDINQAKLKRILLGYARYNPEVGYCQGFNMLGALILQVMDKEESESMKVMIYLVEGVLPSGYFCGSMGGLQADMGVFRELMSSKLPRLAKHLQKLQGPIENAYEPPLTNVFTMQWFLTMFCTCLPMTCVLRVWDLVLIEGSDVLLRTALVLWSLLEERILITRTADDFYCKMGSFSSELLNGHLIDSNGLIEKVVQLGPIADIQRLRDKHLYNIAPLRHKPGLQLYFDDEEPESDEESRLAVATVWGIPWGRRGSGGQTSNSKALHSENKDRIALDISLLKKQYDRLRERQKQAHIIITTACSTAARQGTSNLNATNLPVNQLLMGRSAIVTNKGRRIGPPMGAIPPSRKPSLPTILHKAAKPPEKQLRRGETLHWRDTDLSKRRRDSLTWKEIKADRSALALRGSSEDLQTPRKLRNRMGKSDSSSYSEESEGEGSSTDTSLCDEDDPASGEKGHRESSSVENSPKRRSKISRKKKELSTKLKESIDRNRESESKERKRPKSWAPTNDEIPFMLMTSGSPEQHKHDKSFDPKLYEELTMKDDEDSTTECDRVAYKLPDDLDWTDTRYSRIAGDLATTKLGPLHIEADILELPVITSGSQLSPMTDINEYFNQSALSPIPATKPLFLDSTNSLGSGDGAKNFGVNDDGVTNEYFERVNSVERPTNLNLFYSLSDEDSIRNAYKVNVDEPESIQFELLQSDDIENRPRPTVEGCEASEADRDVESFRCTKIKENHSRTVEPLGSQTTEAIDNSTGFRKQTESSQLVTSSDKKEEEGNGSRSNQAFMDYRKEVTNPTYRKYSLNEASSKRRDTRRLTISRGFSLETCGKYDKDEYDFTEEMVDKDIEIKRDGIATSTDYNSVLAVDKTDKKKVIPSTADLEDRFNRLEKQLSESKKSAENSMSISKEDGDLQSPNSVKSIIDVDTIECEVSERQSLKPIHASESIANEKGDENHNEKSTDSSEDQPLEESETKSTTLIKSAALSNRNKESIEDKVDMRVYIEKDRPDLKHPTETGNAITPKRNIPSADIESPNKVMTSDINCDKTDISKGFDKNEQISKKIPMTTDLEDRFNALERQISSQSNSPKGANAENQKPKLAEGKETTDGHEKGTPVKEAKKTSSKNHEANMESKTNVAEVPTKQIVKDSKNSLKKIPSTAELEDRFNALERSQSDSKQSSPKTKKKPPDDIEKTDKQKISTEKEGDTRQLDSNEELNKVPAKNKSPPSTAELEKRFAALEKSSSENVAPNKGDFDDSVEKPRITNQKCEAKLADENVSKASSKGFIKEEPEKLTERTSTDKLPEEHSSAKSRKQAKDDSVLCESGVKRKEPRRASEPPTTKDLESRYEALQKQLSTKSVAEDRSHKKTKMLTERSETVEEALERIEKDVLEENVDLQESEKSSSKLENTTKTFSKDPIREARTETAKRRSSEPPTTEELEKRYENLKKRMSIKSDINVSTSERGENIAEERKFLKKQHKISDNKADEIIVSPSQSDSPCHDQDAPSDPKSADKQNPHESSTHSPKNTDDPVIPVPPPMQSTPPSAIITSSQDNQRRALVEELHSKITPNDDNLKPSDVNPHRRTSKNRTKVADETSEAHAFTASRRLKKDESSWFTQHQKMVRRFSDLPSRADLENRVYFLEQQLSLKNIKQRSASDSEVASKTRLMGSGRDTEEGPSTSQGNSLENRVKALEKQLSETSVKLLEATQRTSRDNSDRLIDNTSPSRTKAEVLDPDSSTGMELVRYTHYGEIEEAERTKPINISINIKMHLNKELEERQQKQLTAQSTEQFEKRLEALEEKILQSCTEKSGTEEDFKTSEEIKSGRVEESKEIVSPEKEENQKVNADREVFSDTLSDNKKSSEIPGHNKNSDSKTCDKLDSQLEVSKEEEDTQQKEKDATTADTQTEIGKESKKQEMQPATEDRKREAELERPPDTKKTNISEISTEAKIENLASNSSVNPVKDGVEEKACTTHSQETVTDDGNVIEAKSTNQLNSKSSNIDGEMKNQLENSNVSAVDLDRSKNMVLLLDNEPQPVKVRRLTRANTAELEGLLQALEKQLHDRNLIKSNDGKLIRANSVQKEDDVKPSEESKSISDLSKEIQEYTRSDKEKMSDKKDKSIEREETLTGETKKSVNKTEKSSSEQEEDYDWGPDPVKRHLKRSTVYLPSTKELVARYRSLERQIRLLEDVEKIDVEQRLNEIERKIKLQYSLSHEKDLFKFLDLCEGKLPDDEPAVTASKARNTETSSTHSSPSRSCSKDKTPYASPARSRERTPYTSPSRSAARSPATRSPYTSPAHHRDGIATNDLPTTEDLEYRYRVLDLVRSKSKDNLSDKSKPRSALKKQPIHPLEMLLDPSPVESDIPTTGELEHRMRVLNEKRTTPSPPRKPRSRSPTIEDLKREKLIEDRRPKTPIHDLEALVASPTRKDLPTEEELEARMRALEEEKKFDFKMQKNYKEFNQKLKDVISPSLSYEEFKAAKSREQSPKRPLTPKSAIKDYEADYKRDVGVLRSTSPKTIRFREDDLRPRSSASNHETAKMVGTYDGVLKIIEENSKMLHRILKKTLADSSSSSLSDTAALAEGLEVMGPRLMRETSPLRRTGTHTGVPLRTDDNINDRLNSIKNTIKSIDSLCEEKPYRREKCQRYIDSLFNDSVYFTSPSKKSSLEDLAYKRRSGEYAPSIHVSDHTPRPSSEHYLSRSVGSAESLRSMSPLRAASPLHHRSTRDLRRDVSPRRRYGDEEREEYESRVRARNNLLPNYYLDESSQFLSKSSLFKSQDKVDKELDTYKFNDKTRLDSSRSVSRSPLRSPYGSREETSTLTNRNNTTLNHSHTAPQTTQPTTATSSGKRLDLDRPVSPYRQTSDNLLGQDSSLPNSTTSYSPAKLEIRHTTVTSTFYDRVLAEKQIEKSLSRPSSSSPIVSPSVAPRSYLDITPGSSVINPKSGGNSPTTPMRSSMGTAGFSLVASGNTFQTRLNSDPASNTNSTTTPPPSNAPYTAATTPTGNSSAFPNSYIARLPSVIDNNSTELGKFNASHSAGTGAVLIQPADSFTATTTATANTYTSFLTTNSTQNSYISSDTSAPFTTTAASTSYLSSGAGVYNPLMPLNLRPAPDIGIQLNQLHTTTTSNSNINPLSYSVNLPKS